LYREVLTVQPFKLFLQQARSQPPGFEMNLALKIPLTFRSDNDMCLIDRAAGKINQLLLLARFEQLAQLRQRNFTERKHVFSPKLPASPAGY
jgi:hypothetical protein